MHRVVEARDPLALVVSFLDRPTLMQARSVGRGWEEPALAALGRMRPTKVGGALSITTIVISTPIGQWPREATAPWSTPTAFQRAVRDRGLAGLLWLAEHVCGVVCSMAYAFLTDDAALMRALAGRPELVCETRSSFRAVAGIVLADSGVRQKRVSVETICALADLLAMARECAAPDPDPVHKFDGFLAFQPPWPCVDTSSMLVIDFFNMRWVPVRALVRFLELGLVADTNPGDLVAFFVHNGEATAMLEGMDQTGGPVPADRLVELALLLGNAESLRQLRLSGHLRPGCLAGAEPPPGMRMLEHPGGGGDVPSPGFVCWGDPAGDLDPNCGQRCTPSPYDVARDGQLVGFLSELMDPFWGADAAELFTPSWRVWALALVANHDAAVTERLLAWPGFMPRGWAQPETATGDNWWWCRLVLQRTTSVACYRSRYLPADKQAGDVEPGLVALLRWMGREAPPEAVRVLAAMAIGCCFGRGSTAVLDAIADGLAARAGRPVWVSGRWLAARWEPWGWSCGAARPTGDMRAACERLLRPPFVTHDPNGLARALVKVMAPDPDPLGSAPWLAEAPWNLTPAAAWGVARRIPAVPWNAPCAEAAIAAAPTKRLRVLGRLVQYASVVNRIVTGAAFSGDIWQTLGTRCVETDTQAGIACGCVPPFLAVAVGHALAREEPVVPVLFSAGFWARDYAHPRCPGCGPLIAEIYAVANRTLQSAVHVIPDPPAGPA